MEKAEKVRVIDIKRFSKDRDGKPLKGKFGPYERMVIKTEEYPGKQISGFDNLPRGQRSINWQIEDIVEIIIEEKNGYLNFRLPRKEDAIMEKLDRILDVVEGIAEDLNKRPQWRA